MAPARQLPLEQACPDDPSVLDETHLYRRIHPTHFVRDENTNEVRPSSAAFTNSRDGSPMSIALSDTLETLGRPPSSVLDRYPGFALARFPASLPRILDQTVCRSPVDEEPAHGGVGGTKSKSIKRELSRTARWEVSPDRRFEERNDTEMF